MGMTIETDIKILQSRKEEALEEGYKGFASALGNAIATMRKYQKIEQIMSDDWEKGFQHSETVARIREVVEDGKND